MLEQGSPAQGTPVLILPVRAWRRKKRGAICGQPRRAVRRNLVRGQWWQVAGGACGQALWTTAVSCQGRAGSIAANPPAPLVGRTSTAAPAAGPSHPPVGPDPDLVKPPPPSLNPRRAGNTCERLGHCSEPLAGVCGALWINPACHPPVSHLWITQRQQFSAKRSLNVTRMAYNGRLSQPLPQVEVRHVPRVALTCPLGGLTVELR
ncbi:hypothetical protein GCM10009634_65910 [Saccharothrix xinjiangensis]